MYSLTAKGTRALRAWLKPPWPPEVAGVPADPLRTRLELVGALSPGERAAFVAAAIDAVSLHLEIVSRELARRKAAGERLAELAAAGALGALRARLKWLERAGKQVGTKRPRKK